jgi:hypothetical protein
MNKTLITKSVHKSVQPDALAHTPVEIARLGGRAAPTEPFDIPLSGIKALGGSN